MMGTESMKDRIMRVALVEFAAKGYAGTSMRDIAEKCEISKPALYYYFEGKESLYNTLVEQALDVRHGLMRQAVVGEESIEGKLTAIVRVMNRFAAENRELMRLCFAYAFSAPEEVPKKVALRGRNRMFLTELIQEAQDQGELKQGYSSEQLVTLIQGVTMALAMRFVLLPETVVKDEEARSFVELILKGVCT